MASVTIILPTYNHASFLKDRLDSISQQTYQDWEMIIIDDQSSDNSVEILSQFVNVHKPKIKHFIINEKNSGSGYFSWQKGIELAETEFIWIAETDDYSAPTFLEEQLNVLTKHPEISLGFTASNYVDANNKFLYNTDFRMADLAVNDNDYKVFSGSVFINKMPFNTYITNGSSVVFRNPFLKIPDDIFNNRQCSDMFLWTFLLKNGSFAFLNKKLNFFRRHDESTTTKMSIHHKKAVIKEKIKYIRFFNFKNKDFDLVNNYFNYYVWYNKRNFCDLELFDTFELKLKYILMLMPNTLKILLNKIK